MKKSIILVLFVFFSFSLTSYSKDNLNRYGQGLIQKIYQRDTKVDIINRYFNAIEDFSFHYYKVNPILLKDKISQFIKLKKVKEELVVPNLINDVDRYLNYDLIEKSRLNMFKIHLGKFLSEVMLANSFAFNITEIEFEQVKLEVPAIVEDTLKRAMSKIEKQNLADLFNKFNLSQEDLDKRLSEYNERYAAGIDIYDDLARAAIMMNDYEAYQEISNSFGEYDSGELRMDGPLGRDGGFFDRVGDEGSLQRLDHNRDFLREAARIGYDAPLARLRGVMSNVFSGSFFNQDPMRQDHTVDSVNGFVRDFSTAYGGGDYGPSFGPMRNYDKPRVTKAMIKATVSISKRIGKGIGGAEIGSKFSILKPATTVVGFTIGFFSEEIEKAIIDNAADVFDTASSLSAKSPVKQETKPAKTETSGNGNAGKKEPKKEPKVQTSPNKNDEEDEEEKKKKKGAVTRVDPRVLEKLGKSRYMIDKLAKEKMAIEISSETNPGKPSVYERCADDVVGDYLEFNTGTRNIEYLRRIGTNRHVYETHDMPVINFEQNRD